MTPLFLTKNLNFRQIESEKRLSEIVGDKMEIVFLKKVIRKFPSPQSRRQVSANAPEAMMHFPPV